MDHGHYRDSYESFKTFGSRLFSAFNLGITILDTVKLKSKYVQDNNDDDDD